MELPGASAKHRSGHWIRTDHKTHASLAQLVARKPRAVELLHHLLAQINRQNTLTISQSLLAEMMNCSVDTVQRAIQVLVEEGWVQVVQVAKGKEASYVVNHKRIQCAFA
jgi:DNA-binding MarR family transcriptional regulator